MPKILSTWFVHAPKREWGKKTVLIVYEWLWPLRETHPEEYTISNFTHLVTEYTVYTIYAHSAMNIQQLDHVKIGLQAHSH